MAEAAAEEGIKIFTIGVGTEKGGPIPIKRNGVVLKYKKDSSENMVITKLRSKTLNEISDIGNGVYIDGKNTSEVTEKITTILSSLDKKEFEAKEFSEYNDQFQWFLGIALLFIILDVFLLERKTAWLKRLNLFNENL